ncbi:HAD family phosphatase [Mucilaginibacter sp. UR6-11]|uniref:HAD family hydrolase n=1 Tax=Mucilaginibacter sp. UR6-11 TaxID=1435644 RepID=UPI001E64B3BF|nr:HAD-IA family hydrolase [Mucilaginibacter sp. UR6-11]MCC8424753.1 HAD-IA family hydrolase [Mucilaginibacter sp. UR6-11]
METADLSKYDKLVNKSNGRYKAFLYDCDGTLADNMHAHALTYIKVAADRGVTITGEIIDELAGWPVPAVVAEINKRYSSNMDPEEFAEVRQQLYHDEYISKITPVEHVVDHLKAHVGKVRIAVVSGGSREAVEKTLNVLGIADLVETLVCAGETPHGKPAPDPFLAAAKKLGVDPKDCLVFEDGDPGVQSAIAAGMDWVRIDRLD